MLIDTHAHLFNEYYDDIQAVLDRAKENGVEKVVVAADTIKACYEVIEHSKEYDNYYFCLGIHPENIDEDISELEKLIEENKDNPKFVAIGEIGLDYYWNKDNKELQIKAFIKQIDIANELNLPIVIHTREAVMDTIQVLKEHPVTNKGVFHCCPLNRELVKEALKLDFYISFAGVVTFKNAKNADEIINMVPVDKFLIETDSPYLAPEPVRGTRNTPANVIFVAAKVASSRNISIEEIAKASYENACKLFKIF